MYCKLEFPQGLSCSVTKYKGDRTRKTDRIADRHVKIVTSNMSYAQVRERVVLLHSQRKHKGRGERTFESMVYGRQRFESFAKSMCFYWLR